MIIQKDHSIWNPNIRHILQSSFCDLLLLVMLFFPVSESRAQNPGFCSGSAIWNLPELLGTCEFEFTGTLIVQHQYETGHEFIIEVIYDPNLFTVINTGVLTNVTITENPSGFPVGYQLLSGTFLVDELLPDNETVFDETLFVGFTKNYTILGNKEAINVNVIDPVCDPLLVDNFTTHISEVRDVIDLHAFPWNSVNKLVELHILEDCSAPGCPVGNNVLIDDELIIDQNFCFDSQTGNGSGNGENLRLVVLSPGAKITVKSGFTLFLLDVDIFTCGSELAQGIVVESGGTLVMHGCRISDCRFALDAQAGATVSILNNEFVNNFIGTRFAMTEPPYRVTINGFEGNHFFTESSMKTPFPGMPESVEQRGYCGILLDNYLDFNVFGNNVTNVSDGNKFSELANGFIGTRSTLNLGNMSFEDMKSVGPSVYSLEGFGIHLSAKNNTSWANINRPWLPVMLFNDCKTGVYCNRYAGSVSNCTMTNVVTGIDWVSSMTKDIVIIQNTIFATNTGIRSFMNEPVHPVSHISDNQVTILTAGSGLSPVTGILAEEGSFGTNGTGLLIQENTVQMRQGGRGIQYRNGFGGTIRGNIVDNVGSNNNKYEGIWFENAGLSIVNNNNINQTGTNGNASSTGIFSKSGFANVISCNCVDNTSVGLQFFDFGQLTNGIRGNSMNNHDDTGLQLGLAGVPGNTFIGVQYHTGNRWNLSTINQGQFGAINWADVTQNEFRVNCNLNSELCPPTDPANWFVDAAFNTFQCSDICSNSPAGIPPVEQEMNVPDKLDLAIATNDLPIVHWINETNWKGSYRLFRKILRNPSIENAAPEYANFKYASESLSTGALAYIAENRRMLFDLSPTEKNTLDNYLGMLELQRVSLESLDQQRQSGGQVDETQFNILLQSRLNTQAAMEQFYQAIESNRLQSIEQLSSANSHVSTSLAPDTNQKKVNEFILALLANDENLPGNGLSDLQNIAMQCPIQGGDAVYEARSIIHYFTGIDFDDESLCSLPDERIIEQTEQNQKSYFESNLAVLPNPTSGQIFWNDPGLVDIRIFNALGNLEISLSVSGGSLDLSHLNSGLYRIQILRDGRILVMQNMVLMQK